MNVLSRRKFLGQAAGVGILSAFSAKSARANSPSEQINLGIVGCGGRGRDLINTFSKISGVRIAGICDVDQARLGGLTPIFPEAKQWNDMRELFDTPDIDAVVITTPNHWHCLASIWAMQAGKHVYVEKPLGNTHWEGRQVVNAATKYKRVCQIGTQQRSDPMQDEIKKFLHQEKALGEILSVRINHMKVRKSIGRLSKPLVLPNTLDYELWLGPAQDQPIYRNRLHYDWHWSWNTGSGEMGNWGVHLLDDLYNNVFLDQVDISTKLVAGGGRFGWNDAGDTPNVHFAQFEANGVPVVFSLCNLPLKIPQEHFPGPRVGYTVYCTGGRLEGQRGGGQAFDSDGALIRKFWGNSGDFVHQQNFIDAVREEKASLLNAPVERGHISSSWCNFLNIASRLESDISKAEGPIQGAFGSDTAASIYERLKKTARSYIHEPPLEPIPLGPKLMFDYDADQFMGMFADIANPLLRRKDRAGFKIPEISAST